MLIRKIQKTKKESFLLTIPKSYCDLLGIVKGSPVKIEYNHKALIVTPVTPSAKNESQAAQHPCVAKVMAIE